MDENKTINIDEGRSSFFKIKERGSSVKKELMAGAIVFMAMFYITAVQGSFFGGHGASAATFMIVAALTAGLMSMFMGLWVDQPISLASGMGVNAFVAFTLLTGGMELSSALSAVMISGIIFIIVSVTPVRSKIMNSIPGDLKKAISIGVGLFLLYLAVVNAGLIGAGGGTPTFLGNLKDPAVLLGIIGIMLTFILWAWEVEGAVLIAMAVTIAIGLIMNYSGLDALKDNNQLPSFEGSFSGYEEAFTSLGNVIGQSFVGLTKVDQTWANPTWYMAIAILFMMDFFDTTGTLFGIRDAMEEIEVTEEDNKKVLIVDAIGTAFGSICGTTNITIFAESTAGVNAGGRTGLTAVTTGVLFLLSIPVLPILSPLLSYSVTSGAIVLIGVMMAMQLKNINNEDKVTLIASVTIIMMTVLTYSIGTGIVMGLLVYIILMIATGRWSEMDIMLIASSPLFLAFLVLPLIV